MQNQSLGGDLKHYRFRDGAKITEIEKVEPIRLLVRFVEGFANRVGNHYWMESITTDTSLRSSNAPEGMNVHFFAERSISRPIAKSRGAFVTLLTPTLARAPTVMAISRNWPRM
jgi:hypothetical protein